MGKGNRYYRVGNRYRVHGYNEEGKFRIIGWEDIPEDLREYDEERVKGRFRILEWIVNFVPTNSTGVPSGTRNWEVRIQLPSGYTESEVLGIAEDVLSELTNEEMVETSTVNWDKKGEDFIEYSTTEYERWRVVDRARPQYSYPKRGRWNYT